MNILITSAGRRVSLVQYFQVELRSLFGAATKVFTTDLEPSMSTACLASDQGFKVGRFTAPDYMSALLQLCVENKVNLVIPTIDTELKLLAQYRAEFASQGVQVLVSDEHFIDICRNKRATNEFFENYGIETPKEICRDSPFFPLFIKPIEGSSSQDLHRIDSEEQLSPFLRNDPHSLWMALVPTPEYTEFTLDMYYSDRGELRCVVPRVRLEVRNGESNKAITEKNRVLIDRVQDSFRLIEGARGCLTMQLFFNRSNSHMYGIEINPRFGGGYPLSYLAGANYPRWILEEYLLARSPQPFDNWENDVLLLRHDNEVIVRASNT